MDANVLPSVVEEADFSPLLRARENVPSLETAGIDTRRDAVLAALAGSSGIAASVPGAHSDGGLP